MPKERRTPEDIANELAQGSAFFRKPASPQLPALPDELPVVDRSPKSEPVRPVREAKRQMIRHPFELYLDQLDRLRDLADTQRRNGEVGSMSRMVREAIDRYLADSA